MPATPSNPLLEPALLERVKRLTLVARRVVEGALHGLHHSPLHDLSVEFVQHRAYTPGDELKHLDWRVLARSDRYVVKQYRQETNLRAVIFLDCSRSMAYGTAALSAVGLHPSAGGNGSKFHYGQRLAASLAYLLLHQGDSVGLVLSNYRLVAQVPPRAAPGHVSTICAVLGRAAPEGVTDVAGVLERLAARLRRRCLVILISDLLDDPRSVLAALGQLASRGHEVLVFQVLDQREIDFDLGLSGYGKTVIRDMETQTEFDAEPALIRSLVRQEVQRFCAQLDAGARRHGIPLVRCLTSEPLERVLAGYLHTRLRTGKRLSSWRNSAPACRAAPGRSTPASGVGAAGAAPHTKAAGRERARDAAPSGDAGGGR